MNKKISVVYLDDSAISLIAVEKILSTFTDVTFNGGFSNADEALKFCAQRPPDIVFLDVKDKQHSVAAFTATLQLAPNFGLAKNNLKVAESISDEKQMTGKK